MCGNDCAVMLMKFRSVIFQSRMVRIKIILPMIVCLLAVFYSQSVHCRSNEAAEDNDFAEFDDFDSDDEFETITEHSVKSEKQSNAGGANERNDNFQDAYEENDDDDGVVEEESEFEHFRDDEEFEGFNKHEQAAPVETGEPKLTMVWMRSLDGSIPTEF